MSGDDLEERLTALAQNQMNALEKTVETFQRQHGWLEAIDQQLAVINMRLDRLETLAGKLEAMAIMHTTIEYRKTFGVGDHQ